MFTTRARICRQRQRRASLSATSCAVPVSVAYKIVRSRSSCASSSGVEGLEDDVLVLTLARTGSHSDLFGK